MMNKKNILNNKTGFTMIELLIVIVIMGILSAIGLGTFTSSQLKARDSKRKSDLRTIGDALEVYYNDWGNYPIDGGDGVIYGCGTDSEAACTAGSIWSNDQGTTYMVQIPDDPRAGTYYYMSDATGSFYRIYAHLENDQDRDIPEDGLGDKQYYTTPASVSCVIGDCNYGKSSTNVTLGGISS